MREIVIRYTGRQISNNHMKSLHWRKLKKMIDPVKLEMFALVRDSKLPKMERMTLTARYNSRLDVDNVSATSKILVDQIVKAGRLPDDSTKHWPVYCAIYDAGLPKNTIDFLIEIEN